MLVVWIDCGMSGESTHTKYYCGTHHGLKSEGNTHPSALKDIRKNKITSTVRNMYNEAVATADII